MISPKKEFTISDKALAENVINGEYQNDLNIIALHAIMLQKFRYNQRILLPQLKDKIKTLELQLEKPLHIIDRKKFIAEIEIIKRESDEIEFGNKIEEYKERVNEIIQSYSRLGHLRKEIRFKNSSIPEIQEDKNESFRHYLITRYLEIIRNYIEVNIIRKFSDSDKCSECNNLICYCNKEIESQKEISMNSVSRNNYENRENFRKALMRYQGKESNELPKDLYERLDFYFMNYKLPKGKDIKELNVNHEWNFKGTSRELLIKALYDIDYRDYYKHVYLICHEYWGWVLPDVSHLEDTIMEDYDKSQRVYERLKPKNKKKSCMNVQYRLFRLLERRGHNCKPEDFKIVRTRDILEEYEDTWEQICRELNWTFRRIL